jgi:2-dehydro-3-deoxygluconokinase
VVNKPVVCFGEVLLRFSAPGRELLLQSPRLDVSVGGAEANVAVSLTRLGDPASLVSVLPDNPLGRAARDELRRHGVDISQVAWRPGRMGVYYLSPGAVLRPSEVTYDREGSSFAEADAEAIDWEPILGGAGRLHLSGVTPALGPRGAQAAIRAAEAANKAGVPVSFDGNYRAKLWERWQGDSPSVLKQLFNSCDIAFADQRDIALVLQREFAGDPAEQLQQAAAAAFDAFPRLQVLACTHRVQHSVDRHELSATLLRRDARWDSRSYSLEAVVDRVGAGDAFVAGLLFAMRQGRKDAEAVEFALAASVLKHSVWGDFNLVSQADVEHLLHDGGLGVRR